MKQARASLPAGLRGRLSFRVHGVEQLDARTLARRAGTEAGPVRLHQDVRVRVLSRE